MPADKTAEPFAAFQGEMYNTWEKAMGAWWDQVLESPAFYDTVKSVGPMAQARGQYRQAMDSALRELQLPTRDDVVRLTKIVTQVEDRLLAQEDLLLQVQDRLIAMEKESLKARIEAAEARIAAEAAGRASAAAAPAPAEMAAVAPTAPVSATAPANSGRRGPR
jgi:Tfp pilus assembly protein PilF